MAPTGLDLSHRALLSRWKSGDAAAVFELLNLHHEALMPLVRTANLTVGRASMEDHQDLLTDIALALAEVGFSEFSKSQNADEPASFLSVCEKLAKELVGTILERSRTEESADHPRLDELSNPPDGTYFPGDHSFRLDMNQAYELLSERDPQLMKLLALSFEGGLTEVELVGHFGVHRSTIYRRKRRALSVLAQAFGYWESRFAKKEEGAFPPDSSEHVIVERPRVQIDLISPELLVAIQRHPDLLRTLDWRKFELVLARILEEFEYEVALTSQTADGGVDIFALKQDGTFGPERFLLQAKRWSTAVGVVSVRELLFLHNYHRVSKSCLATTSTFTRGAWRLGWEYRWQLDLRDFDLLHQWIEKLRREK